MHVGKQRPLQEIYKTINPLIESQLVNRPEIRILPKGWR